MSEQQQQTLERTIATLATLAREFAGSDQYVASTLGSTHHALAQHLAACRWNAWIASREAGQRKRQFVARHTAARR